METTITDIFFDLDHTLWDFKTNSDAAFTKLLTAYDIPVEIDMFLSTYEPINHAYWDAYAKQHKTKEEVKYGRLTDTFAALHIDIPAATIPKLAEDYLVFLKKETALMPGTIEILDYLKDKYRLHILTNGFIEVQQEKLENAGIQDYFKNMITSEETGKLKPHPDVFHHALKVAQTFAHQSFMVGDNLKTDVLGARNIGMHAIHYDPDEVSDIDFKIIPKVKHLLEIKEIL